MPNLTAKFLCFSIGQCDGSSLPPPFFLSFLQRVNILKLSEDIISGDWQKIGPNGANVPLKAKSQLQFRRVILQRHFFTLLGIKQLKKLHRES